MKSHVAWWVALFLCFGLSAAHASLPKADLVVVKKSQYSLELLKDGKPIKRFWIALGQNPKGAKLRKGDLKTPEGRYLLDYKKDSSGYYKAMHISYPNLNDLQRAKMLGVDPGNMVMVHGQPNDVNPDEPAVQKSNWTNGCIAVNNKEMDEIWQAVRDGTTIRIVP